MKNSILVVLLLYISYGFVLTNGSYLASFLFKKQEEAARWTGGFVSLTVSLTFLIVTLFLRNDMSDTMGYLLCLIPTFSLYHGIVTLGLAIVEAQPITLLSVLTLQPGFGRKIGITILIIIAEAIVFFSAVMYVRCMGCCQ